MVEKRALRTSAAGGGLRVSGYGLLEACGLRLVLTISLSHLSTCLVCVCAFVVFFVKNGPETYKSVKPEGGIPCSAGFCKSVRGAAVAALQEKRLTNRN